MILLTRSERRDPLGERLSSVAREQRILLMLCDQCATERGLAIPDESGGYRPIGTVEGVRVGCFPDLYAALATTMPDQVMTLERNLAALLLRERTIQRRGMLCR